MTDKDKRILQHIELYLEGYTIRQIAKLTGYSKSLIHLDIHTPNLNSDKIQTKIEYNYANRGLYGATAHYKKNYFKSQKNT